MKPTRHRQARKTALEQAQEEAVALITQALDEAGLAHLGDPDGTAVAYVRMSRAIGTEAKGVQRDAERVVRWAKEVGLDLRPDPATGLPVFVDNSISASRFADDNRRRRPAYDRLIAEVEAGALTVVAPHMDRLYRRNTELEDLIKLTIRRDDAGSPFTLTTLADSGFDLNTSDGRAHARVVVTMAAHQSERTHDRLMIDNQAKRDRGEWTSGQAPMGYRRVKAFPGLELDPATAPLVRDAAKAIVRGVTLTEIADEWEAAGVPHPRGGELAWSPTMVRQRMKPALTGLLAYRRKDGTVEHYEGAWQPIIDRPTWEALQAVLASNADVFGRGPRRRGPFTRLFVCARCGGWLYRQNRHDRLGKAAGKWRWRCNKQQGGCGSIEVAGAQAEAWVKGHAAHYLHAEQIEADAASLGTDDEVDRLATEVHRVKGRMAELEHAFQAPDSTLSAVTFDRMTARFQRELDAASRALGEAQRKALTLTDAWLTDEGELAADLDAMTDEELGRVLHLAYPRGVKVHPAPKGKRVPPGSRLEVIDRPDA